MMAQSLLVAGSATDLPGHAVKTGLCKPELNPHVVQPENSTAIQGAKSAAAAGATQVTVPPFEVCHLALGTGGFQTSGLHQPGS